MNSTINIILQVVSIAIGNIVPYYFLKNNYYYTTVNNSNASTNQAS